MPATQPAPMGAVIPLTLQYNLNNVCNASFSRHTDLSACRPRMGSRTKINYSVSITLYIVVVKENTPIYSTRWRRLNRRIRPLHFYTSFDYNSCVKVKGDLRGELLGKVQLCRSYPRRVVAGCRNGYLTDPRPNTGGVHQKVYSTFLHYFNL